MSEQPAWGDNFDHYNEQDTQRGGPTTAYVVGINHATHRVDLQLPLFGNIIIPDVRVGTAWHAGSGTGDHNLPPLYAECKVTFRQGKSAGYLAADVDHLVFSDTTKPPSHPAMAGQTNFKATQGAVNSGDHVTPGTLEMLDNAGGKHSLVMGKRVERGRGQTDVRDDGLSITHAETQMMQATNLVALADLKAKTLNPVGDLNALSLGLKSVAGTMGEANRATSVATEAFGAQVIGGAESLSIGQNAAALATGAAMTDSLI